MLVQLQYLRAIAALMVVYFHAILQLAEGQSRSRAPNGFIYGETGVDIFFVLSGFVMWLTTSGREMTPGRFLPVGASSGSCRSTGWRRCFRRAVALRGAVDR